MSVQSWLNRVWYDRGAPPWWMMPFSLVYGGIAGVRRLLYVKHIKRASRISCPVIVVGNLSVGGTGKTPLVCWLVSRLAERGYVPGIVTRGYGGSASNVRRVTAADGHGRDRPAAAHLLVNAGCNVIVSDDGLQHYALARDCEVVVIDGDRQFGNGWLLPAGPLREPPGRMAAADAIVVNGGRALRKGALSMRLEARNAVALCGGAVQPLSGLVGRTIHAVAGIGNPERFFNMLRSRGIEVGGRPLADHAQLTRADIYFGDDKPVLMTEKDAVKCAAFAGPQHWYVPVSACFDGAESRMLLDVVLKKITNRDVKSQGRLDG
jgi:tetraacyldisaccharide 4'-kinase